ncbi:hypothetical protein BLOT_001655 [Blomia tropicalis]|nr:hypothetical protein BLOT_001655 [Blomia tropicalis]
MSVKSSDGGKVQGEKDKSSSKSGDTRAEKECDQERKLAEQNLDEQIKKNAKLLQKIFEKTRDNPNDWTNCERVKIEISDKSEMSSSGIESNSKVSKQQQKTKGTKSSSSCNSNAASDSGSSVYCSTTSAMKSSNTSSSLEHKKSKDSSHDSNTGGKSKEQKSKDNNNKNKCQRNDKSK